MNAQQAQILLEKINALWRSMHATPGQISAIERDLMLSYIRQLYDIFLAGQLAAPQLASRPMSQAPPPPPVVRPEAAKPTPEAPPPTAPQPEPAPPPSAPVQVIAPPPKAQPTPPPAPKSAPPTPKATGQLESLFSIKPSGELSDKLSRQPIADLTKAFAINDRLLYINELFGKDSNAFVENVRLLNSMSDFAEAKNHLIQLAQQHHWLDEERVESAQTFIQLVQRRFLK